VKRGCFPSDHIQLLEKWEDAQKDKQAICLRRYVMLWRYHVMPEATIRLPQPEGRYMTTRDRQPTPKKRKVSKYIAKWPSQLTSNATCESGEHLDVLADVCRASWRPRVILLSAVVQEARVQGCKRPPWFVLVCRKSGQNPWKSWPILDKIYDSVRKIPENPGQF